jgi:methyl-accepting chemotaxis protein
MYHRILQLLIVLLLAGCGNIPLFSESKDMRKEMPSGVAPVKVLDPTTNTAPDYSSDRFAEGLDNYLATGDLTSLRIAAEKDVGGAWGARAEAMIRLDEKIDGLNHKITGLNDKIAGLNEEIDGLNKKLEKQQAQLENKEKLLTHSLETKELLSRDNEILEVTLERLRQALSDLQQSAR